MDQSIVSRPWLLKQYDEARKTLEPAEAVAHVAGITGLDPVQVESVVQGREAMNSAAEVA